MFKKFVNKLIADDDEAGKAAIDYMVELPDDDYKRVAEAIKMYRKGNSARDEYFDKAQAILARESQDFIPVEMGGENE